MNASKPILSNVSIIRPILLVLLVFYHAFAIYSGAWAPIEGYPEVPAYWWLDKLSYAFMLEMFVFISGYVFGFQVRTKGMEKLNAKNLLWSKFKRLMIPCMAFSLLYILLFLDIKQPLYQTAYDLINGVGHMWFLPMLFWCFAGIWLIEIITLKPQWVIPVLALCSVFSSFLPLPLRMSNAMYYMLFFYVGYYLQKDNISLDRFYTLKHSSIAILTFFILFPSLTVLKTNLISITRWGYLLAKLFQLCYSSVGIAMLFIMVGYLTRQRTKKISDRIISVGNLCFGVYLWQQFVLLGLYQYTILPNVLGCYLLPWFGFFTTLIISVLVSKLLIKTKVGRYLIG